MSNVARIISLCACTILMCACTTYAERVNSDGEGTRVVHAAAPAPSAAPLLDPTVRVERVEPPRGCRLLGVVQGAGVFGQSYEKSIRGLQEKTTRLGGNWVTLDATGGYSYAAAITRGRAFFCDDAALAQLDAPTAGDGHAATRSDGADKIARDAPTVTTAATRCEPDCSPGFTCLRGRCVSACNPACDAGERCGADRVCHRRAD